MKKYFLMGFVALAFTACVSDKEVIPQTKEQKYAAAFENFVGGQVNENVNWGFNDQQIATFDADGKFTGMKGVNANGNEWGIYVDVPQPLTDAQKKVVTDWFKANKNPEGIAVNWSDFFVQQVYEGEWGKNMNYLYCGSDTDHTFNFNAGNAGVYDPVCYGLNSSDINDRIYGKDQIEFMVNSSTEYFGFHNSFDSNFYKDNYVIIPGDIIDESVAGMFFVGFDFEAHGEDANTQQVERDYYFDNWIVKITPGMYKNRERVMAEDLIDSDLDKVDISDWDFNDAVFDVAFLRQTDVNDNYQEHDYAIITLWAAGGTKSLTVAGKEVHELFGQPVSKMINTNAENNGVDGLPQVIFRIDYGRANYNKTFNANDIPVKVEGIELEAKKGKATQKFEVPKDTRWMKERKIITGTYTQFKAYVLDNSPLDWYATVENTENLY